MYKNKERQKENHKKWVKKNKEHVRDYQRNWVKENPEKVRINQRRYDEKIRKVKRKAIKQEKENNKYF